MPTADPSPSNRQGPVIIGGLGGSGTRVYAELMRHAGFHVGSRLNTACDNLWVTLLLKRRYEALDDPRLARLAFGLLEKRLWRGGRMTFDEHRLLWRTARDVSRNGHGERGEGTGSWAWRTALSLARATPPRTDAYRGWGFKEPNTHVFLELLAEHFESMRYVYVLRHGLDMAFSGNNQQLYSWGERYGIERPTDRAAIPSRQLDYWLAATHRAVATGRELLGDRFLVLRYDDLFPDPAPQLEQLALFLGVTPSVFEDPKALAWIERSSSVGRYRHEDLSIFTDAQLDGVREQGFSIHTDGAAV